MTEVGYGSIVELSVNGGGFVEVDEVFDLTPPAPSKANVVANYHNMPSDATIRIDGKIIDYGQTSFSLNWTPGSDADTLIHSLVTATSLTVRETFPNGAYWSITGLFASMTPAVPIDDKMTAEVTLDTSGALARTAAAVPSNEVRPSIVGASVQVGVTLTAIPGEYTGGPTSYAYQWQHDASGNGTFVNVAVGGTSETYVPVVGDIADFLRVGITPTNSAGAGSTVYSLPVGPIIAA
jgi:hypothetical protein